MMNFNVPGYPANFGLDPPEPPRELPGISKNAMYIMRQLHTQYKDGRNCDLEIRCKDTQMYAHKCMVDIFMLSAGAELENDLFYLDQKSFTKETIEPLVEMMYTGQLKVIPRIINQMHEAAFRLGYKAAEKACIKYKDQAAAIDNVLQAKPTEKRKGTQEGLKELHTSIEHVPASKNLYEVIPINSLQEKRVDQSGKSVSNVVKLNLKETAIHQGKPYKKQLKDVQKKTKKLSKVRNKDIENHGSEQEDTEDFDEDRNETGEKLAANEKSHGKKRKHGRDDESEPDSETFGTNSKRKKNGSTHKQSEEGADPDADIMAEYLNDRSYLGVEEPEFDNKDKIEKIAESNPRTNIKSATVSNKSGNKKKKKKLKIKVKNTARKSTGGSPPTGPNMQPKVYIDRAVEGVEAPVDHMATVVKTEPVTDDMEQSNNIATVVKQEAISPENEEDTEGRDTTSSTRRSTRKKKQVNYTNLGQSETNNECDEDNFDEYINNLNSNKYLNTRNRYLDYHRNTPAYPPTKAVTKVSSVATEAEEDTENGVNYTSNYYPAAGIVPQGVRSTYAVGGIETKRVTQTITNPKTGQIKVITKEVPVRTTLFKPKKKAGPTIVICHPTAPVVKMQSNRGGHHSSSKDLFPI